MTATWFFLINKYAKTLLWRKASLFNKWYWQNCISIRKRIILDPYPLLCTPPKKEKRNNRISWCKIETLKLLEGKVRKVLKDTGKGWDFLKQLSRSWQMGLMKLKGFYTSEETLTVGENLCCYISDRSIQTQKATKPRNQTIHLVNGLREWTGRCERMKHKLSTNPKEKKKKTNQHSSIRIKN